MKPPRFLPVILAGLVLGWTGSASTYRPGMLCELANAIETAAPVSMLTAGSIEVNSSPKGGAGALMLYVIDFTKTDIKALSYSSTNPHVVTALLRAARRGVAVSLVADYKNNITDDRSGKGRVALSMLAEIGCNVCVIPAYPIHHSKMLIVDHQTIGLGSFNYSDTAARMNSENVLVD